MLTYSYVLFCPRLELIPSHGVTVGPGVDYVTLTLSDPDGMLKFFNDRGIEVRQVNCVNPELAQEYVLKHGVRKLGQSPPHLLECPSSGQPPQKLNNQE